MEKEQLILIGGGGHCKSCIDVIESTHQFQIEGILDFPEFLGTKILNNEIIGNDDDIEKYHKLGYSFLITVGQIKAPQPRKKIFEKLESIGAKIATVISPKAIVSPHAKIEKGSIIMHGATINAGATIGKNCIINSHALIEHDAHVGNHTHVSTKAVINGDATVGDECFIGSCSCISNGIEIKNQVIIGAGSVVIKNISESGIFAGVPCKKIR